MHKANILKALTGLFLETGRELAKQVQGPRSTSTP